MGRKPLRRVSVKELQTLLLEAGCGRFIRPFNDYDEVHPGVFLGTKDLAWDLKQLKELGFTHVLNAAQGDSIGQINTNPGYYRRSGIEFYGVPARDHPTFNIRPFFKQAAWFIDTALYGRGKVYVHCECGISRSAVLIVAWLMLKRGLSARQSLAAIRTKRSIFPNEGFLEQLSDLDYYHQERGLLRPEPEMFDYPSEVEARYEYPLEYYHYPSLYPRVTTHFLKKPFSRSYTPPPTLAEVRARSEDRGRSRVVYRETSLPRARSLTPTRDLVPYNPDKIHVYGSRTPYTDNYSISYRPSIVSHTQKAIRAIDYDTGPTSFSTYRTANYYKDLPSTPYMSRQTSRIRYNLEPRFTSPISSSIVPSTRYSSSTLSSPSARYMSTPTRVYISYPTRYNTPSYYYGQYDPAMYKSHYTQHIYGLGYPTRYETYRLVHPSIYDYSDYYRY